MVKLLKSRKKLDVYGNQQRKTSIDGVFKDLDCSDDTSINSIFEEIDCSDTKLKFKFHSFVVPDFRKRISEIYAERRERIGCKQTHVVVGKTSLLISVLKSCKYQSATLKCCNYSLGCYNL